MVNRVDGFAHALQCVVNLMSPDDAKIGSNVSIDLKNVTIVIFKNPDLFYFHSSMSINCNSEAMDWIKALVDDEAGMSGDNHSDDHNEDDESEGSMKDFIKDEASESDRSSDSEPPSPPRHKTKVLKKKRRRIVESSDDEEEEDETAQPLVSKAVRATNMSIPYKTETQAHTVGKIIKAVVTTPSKMDELKKSPGLDRPVNGEMLFGTNVSKQECSICKNKAKANYYVKTDMNTFFDIRRICTVCKQQTAM